MHLQLASLMRAAVRESVAAGNAWQQCANALQSYMNKAREGAAAAAAIPRLPNRPHTAVVWLANCAPQAREGATGSPPSARTSRVRPLTRSDADSESLNLVRSIVLAHAANELSSYLGRMTQHSALRFEPCCTLDTASDVHVC